MAEYVPTESTKAKILCCECGITIEPNPTNCCLACIRSKYDITQDIQKNATIIFCSGCERYLDPPNNWVFATLESKELLRLCMKKLKGLNQVKLVDAGFIWTEPHSKRIKVKLEVQKEIHEGATIQQSFVTEFVVHHQMCNDCHRVEAKDYWNALVQVRQKVEHKRTFYYLEQLILKHKMHDQSLGIKPVHGGLDFFFANDQTAHRLLDFLNSVIPCRWTQAKKLKSHDIHSNVYNYKRSYSVEIVPLCKDNIVCLPKKLAHRLGGIGQLCLVQRITNHIFLIDPATAQVAEMNSSDYWKSPFLTLCTSKNLIEFIVIDTEEAPSRHFKGQGQISYKHKVGEVWVQRASELGSGDSLFCRSHLGHLIKPGDSVYGFDVKNSNLNDDEFDKIDPSNLPDVILVKKHQGSKLEKNRKREWRHRNPLSDGHYSDDDTSTYIESDFEGDGSNFLKSNESQICATVEEMFEMLNVSDSPDEDDDSSNEH